MWLATNPIEGAAGSDPLGQRGAPDGLRRFEAWHIPAKARIGDPQDQIAERLRGSDLIVIYERGDVADEMGNMIGNILDEC